MSSGKVRIYELSRELNLENKDILDICDKLNIVVKSHSSTITESDADRIRVAADKYTPVTAQKTTEKATHLSSGEKKQQILAIRKQPKKEPEIQKELEVIPPEPSLTLAAEINQLVDDQDNTLAKESPVNKLVNVTPVVKLENKPTPPSRSTEGIAPIKRRINIEGNGNSSGIESAHYGDKGPGHVTPRPLKKTDRDRIETIDRPVTRPLPPQRKGFSAEPPRRPGVGDKVSLGSGTEEKLSTVDDDGVLNLGLGDSAKKPQARKPLAPRIGGVKKSTWEEEEEEENAKKAAKVVGKNKRRSVVIEDDEDLEDQLGNMPLPASVSLSIARPPKPNTRGNIGPSVVTLKQPKKAGPRSEHQSKSERNQAKSTGQEKPSKIFLSGSLTVQELADELKIGPADIIRNLFIKGIGVSITQTLDLQTARLVAEDLEVEVETIEEQSSATKTTEMLDLKDLEHLIRRPPVVTIMGHVDHGKTTLLDSIRKTKVAQGEAGGITQHIGAYHVDVVHEGKEQQIVFLDTPGHEAFTAMRARGARVTDIAILVVAADDGVQPQTREAISHARAAGVPIVVAINKVDKLQSNPDRVKQELSDLGLLPEEWGGDTIMVPVSALKGDNLDTLLEMIILVSEVAELSANPNRPAKGTVVEANLDRTKGPVATLLIQNGTLKVGDIIVAGPVFGKIRAMIDDRGNRVEKAGPSFAVEILGLNDVPAAGDEFDVFSSEKEARELAETRADSKKQTRLQQAMASRRVSLTSLSAKAQEGELKELNLILKSDVQGSGEAILSALEQLPQKEVQVRVLLASAGEVTETDVDLAAASGAVILGFSTTLASGARAAAEREGVDIREYNIIYKLLDDVQGAMEGLLDPEEVEEHLGQAEVRNIFPVGRGTIAGSYVLSGKIVRNRLLRVKRGDSLIYQGTVESLKRFKEDSKEVNAGYECGIGAAKFNDWKEGDIIECYEMAMKRRTLSVN